MPPLSHFVWPFFAENHRQFGVALSKWADKEAGQHIDHTDVDKSCRALVRALGKAGWLRIVVPAAYGGLSEKLDVRTLCAAREILAWYDSLADFAFAMQGLGTGSISLFGNDETKGQIFAAGARRPSYCGFCANGTGGRLRCERASNDRDQGRPGTCPH